MFKHMTMLSGLAWWRCEELERTLIPLMQREKRNWANRKLITFSEQTREPNLQSK
jgi:hypothetical protein